MRDEDPRENRRRACPFCRKPIMALATLCGYCWRKVSPVAFDRAAADTFPDTATEVGIAGGETAEYLSAPRRACPRCSNTIMAAATTCGFCWSRVAAVP